jgi:hypothetical protein
VPLQKDKGKMAKHHRDNLIKDFEKVSTSIFELKSFELLDDSDISTLDEIAEEIKATTEDVKRLIGRLKDTPSHIPKAGNEIESFTWEDHDKKSKVHSAQVELHKLQKKLRDLEAVTPRKKKTTARIILDNDKDRVAMEGKLLALAADFKMKLSGNSIMIITEDLRSFKEAFRNASLDDYGYVKEEEE